MFKPDVPVIGRTVATVARPAGPGKVSRKRICGDDYGSLTPRREALFRNNSTGKFELFDKYGFRKTFADVDAAEAWMRSNGFNARLI